MSAGNEISLIESILGTLVIGIMFGLVYTAGFISGRIDALVETRDWLVTLIEGDEK